MLRKITALAVVLVLFAGVAFAEVSHVILFDLVPQ